MTIARLLQQRNPRYQVQRDDVMLITFALSPELNQQVTIQPDGYINLQNVGSLYVQGMTVPEVVEALKKILFEDTARSDHRRGPPGFPRSRTSSRWARCRSRDNTISVTT